MTPRIRLLTALVAALLLAALPTTAQAIDVLHGKWGGDIEFRVLDGPHGQPVVHLLGEWAGWGSPIIHRNGEFQSCRYLHGNGVVQSHCIRGTFTSAGHAEGDFWFGLERQGEHPTGHVLGEWKARFGR